MGKVNAMENAIFIPKLPTNNTESCYADAGYGNIIQHQGVPSLTKLGVIVAELLQYIVQPAYNRTWLQ